MRRKGWDPSDGSRYANTFDELGVNRWGTIERCIRSANRQPRSVEDSSPMLNLDRLCMRFIRVAIVCHDRGTLFIL
jgi:hypothetical protein